MAGQDQAQQGQPQQPPNDQQEENNQKEAVQNPRSKARGLFIGGIVLLFLVIGGVVWYLHSRTYEDTDDAEIDGNIHPIASRVEGTVIGVGVHNDQPVNQGELLVQLDPKDYNNSLDQAKANFEMANAQAQAQDPNVPIIQVTNATDLSTGQAEVENAKAGVLAAQHDQASTAAQLEQAKANSDKAQLDLDRYTRLLQREEVSQQDFDQYRATARAQAATVSQQEAALRAAAQVVNERRAQLAEQQARLRQSQMSAPRQLAIRKANIISSKANAAAMQAQANQAGLNLSYTKIYAPVSGIVTERIAETGSKVSVGQQLMVIVQTDDLWVTANFRETQLRKMRTGQHVKVHVDSLDENFDGYIENMPAATGDRSSVLPPENATGNYVKVVQRLPVRIRLYEHQRDAERLRPGMSVEPKVSLD